MITVENYLVIAIRVIIIVLLGALAYMVVRRGLRFLFDREYLPLSIHAMAHGIFRWFIIIVVTLMALQQAGVSVTHLWAAISAFFVLIAVGFVAVWSVLSNILCSILLIVFAPFRIGDEIEVIEPTGNNQGLKGRVTGLNILFTTLEQRVEGSDEVLIVEIPNNIFFQKTIRRVLRSGETTSPLKHAKGLR